MGFNKKQEIEKTQRLSLHGTVDEEDRKQPRSRGNDDLLPKPPPQMPTAAQIPILKIQREKTKELDITQPLTEGKPKPIGHQKRTSTSSKKEETSERRYRRLSSGIDRSEFEADSRR
ncbi:hypothetical protein M3Y94_00489800 [Aphelenchoides besseyi]|nr:hypothetical protein M3Y94_00489800 [Aphelenchoides besseyi]